MWICRFYGTHGLEQPTRHVQIPIKPSTLRSVYTVVHVRRTLFIVRRYDADTRHYVGRTYHHRPTKSCSVSAIIDTTLLQTLSRTSRLSLSPSRTLALQPINYQPDHGIDDVLLFEI